MYCGFNPSVGILGGQTARRRREASTHRRFQSLSRDSWWSNPPIIMGWPGYGQFQSLSRDSWWSNNGGYSHFKWRYKFQSLSRDSWWSNFTLRYPGVIGRSCFNPSVGILGGQTPPPPKATGPGTSFNPSVGILGGQTLKFIMALLNLILFQSLSRDSWWSNSVWNTTDRVTYPRFNPSVGILGGQTCRNRGCGWPQCRFNPSVGILGGQTLKARCRSSST